MRIGLHKDRSQFPKSKAIWRLSFMSYILYLCLIMTYRGADKFLARPGRKQARKNAGTLAISTTSRSEISSSFFFQQGKVPKKIHAILTETLACFLPDRAQDLSAPLYSMKRACVFYYYKILILSDNYYVFFTSRFCSATRVSSR